MNKLVQLLLLNSSVNAQNCGGDNEPICDYDGFYKFDIDSHDCGGDTASKERIVAAAAALAARDAKGPYTPKPFDESDTDAQYRFWWVMYYEISVVDCLAKEIDLACSDFEDFSQFVKPKWLPYSLAEEKR